MHRTISRLYLLALLRAEELKVPIKHLQPEACYATVLEGRAYLPKRKSDPFRLSRVGEAAEAQLARRGQLTKKARPVETSVEVEPEDFPRGRGSADEPTPSCAFL